MAAFSIPDDPYYDYLPIDGANVQIGMDILCVSISEGTVGSITPPGDEWAYTLAQETPWGTDEAVTAVFPDDPSTQPAAWWQRFAVWTRTDKPGDRQKITLSDGSRWIYSTDGDGLMVCFHSGSSRRLNDRAARGQLTTDSRDRFVPTDVSWDWLPVLDGATVDVADYLVYASPRVGIVDEIVTTELTEGYLRTEIRSGGDALGIFDEPGPWPRLPVRTLFFRRLLKPRTYSCWSAPDGSRWVYADSAYFCWDPGSNYRSGTVIRRGAVAGLTEIPDPPAPTPPQIREVVQTPDSLVSTYTLSTSGSVVAGDVLLIVYGVVFFGSAPTVANPTSSAGTVVQVGTDASDGAGNGLVRIYRCEVGSSGSHTVDIPNAGSEVIMGVVLVLTDDAATDGFAKSSLALSMDSVVLPSVTPSDPADLLVGVFFNVDSRSFALGNSSLSERATVSGSTGSLAIGSVELESSDPTPGYAVPLSGNAFSVALAIALTRP